MREHSYQIPLRTPEGMGVIGVEIESLNIAVPVYSRFLLNCSLVGEFDGLLLNRVAVRDWKLPLKNSFQGEAIMTFLGRRLKKDLDNLSRLRVLILLNMELKKEFRGRGLGAQILKLLIEHPSHCYPWDVSFGWARSKDGKRENNHLNQAAAKILGHYMKHLPNCVQWTERSTFFLCAPGQIRAANATDYLQELTQRD